jgi:mono/diheme cytochrome c family protein
MKVRASRIVWLPLLGMIAGGPSAALAADAKELFVASKCVKCHSIESQGVAATPTAGDEDKVHDLSKVGSERTADWIQKFLTKQTDLDGKKHKLKFRGSEADLQTLATWLASLGKQ